MLLLLERSSVCLDHRSAIPTKEVDLYLVRALAEQYKGSYKKSSLPVNPGTPDL